jgi:hypothetical protein
MRELPKRVMPPGDADERTQLRMWLDVHRVTFAQKLQGLTPEQLAMRSAEPSAISLLGLLQHHAEGERWMFRCLFLGEEDVPYFGPVDFGDFTGADDELVARSWDAWHDACDRSREIEAATDLDTMSVEPGPWIGQPVSMRWLLLHVIDEYARHNGHADLLRERIDGTTGW